MIGYVKVKNGKIINEEFPKEYITEFENGYYVNKSAFFLKEEGWLVIVYDRPRIDKATHYLEHTETLIMEDHVVYKFTPVPKVEEEDFEIEGEYIS